MEQQAWLTIDEAAQVLRLSRSTVLRRIEQGLLVKSQAFRWAKVLISRASIDKLLGKESK